MSRTVRVFYSIRPELVSRFNAVFKGGERSRVVERLMERAIEERESEVVAAVGLVETDPDFAAARAVSADVDALSADMAPHLS
jgi:hypothetical protein